MRRIWTLALVLVLLLTSPVQAARHNFAHSLAGKHVTVLYGSSDRAFAQQVLDAAETAYDKLVGGAGFRAPRALPVPVLIQADDPSLGGVTDSADLGYDLNVAINPKMDADMSVADVVAHEFFHVLQSSYTKGGEVPTWAVEGTAPVGGFYGLERPVLPTDLSLYWTNHATPMKTTDYDSSLFWYVTAEKYGGPAYLRRVLEWSENVEWERAAQLAALQGGAPPETTFDTLWRSFVLDMVDGRLPKGYTTTDWFWPQTVEWTGGSMAVTHGERVAGTNLLGQSYAFYEPMLLGPYSFTLLEIQHQTAASLELTLAGDADVLEAYVIRPGPNLADALADGSLAPSAEHPAAPPSDPDTVGAPLPLGQPVRLAGAPAESTLVLVLRLGTWGYGGYQLNLRVAPASAPGAAAPEWLPLARLPQGPDSPGAPPRLSPAELKALEDGTWLQGAQPLAPEAAVYHTVELTVGATTAVADEQQVTLPVAPEADGFLWVFVPAKAVSRLLGWSVSGSRISNGGGWAELTPGSAEVRLSNGVVSQLGRQVRARGDECMALTSFFSLLGCDVYRAGSTVSISYPGRQE